MRATAIPFEVPWLATMSDGKLHLNDKAGYDRWIGQAFGDGERAMVLVLPLASDHPRFHESVYRYWRGCVLPIIAEEIGEANLDTAHDVVVAQLTGVQAAPKKRRGLKLKRKSTAMDSMSCDELCELIDRAIVWATTDLHLDIPLADPAWKWHAYYEELERRSAAEHGSRVSRGSVHGRDTRDGVQPSAAPGERA